MLALNIDGNFWLSVLTDLQNRGVEDIRIASVDDVTGFPQAIASISKVDLMPYSNSDLPEHYKPPEVPPQSSLYVAFEATKKSI